MKLHKNKRVCFVLKIKDTYSASKHDDNKDVIIELGHRSRIKSDSAE